MISPMCGTEVRRSSNAGKSRFPMGSSPSQFGGGKGVSQGVGLGLRRVRLQGGEMQELCLNDGGESFRDSSI